MPIDPNLWGGHLEEGRTDDAELALAARLGARRPGPARIDESFRRELRARLLARRPAPPAWRFAAIGVGLTLTAALALAWLILSRPNQVAEPASPTPEATWDPTDVASCATQFGPMPGTPRPADVIATQGAQAVPGGYPGMQADGPVYAQLQTDVAEATRSLATHQAEYLANCLHPSTPLPTPTLDMTPGADLPPGLIFRSNLTLFRVGSDGRAESLGPLADPGSLLSADGEREYYLRYDVQPRLLIELDRRTNQARQLAELPAELTLERGLWPGHSDRLLLSGDFGTGGSDRAVGYVDLNTGESTVVVHHVPGDASVSFSSDGRTLAYSLADSVVVVDSQSGETTTVTLADLDTGDAIVGHVGWSRDRRELIVETGTAGILGESARTIAAYDLETHAIREITRDDNPVQRSAAEIIWSPDGEWLAVPTFQMVDMSGTLVFGACIVRQRGGEAPWCGDSLAAWSPDGTQAILRQSIGVVITIAELGSWHTRQLSGLPAGAAVVGWAETERAIAVAPTSTITPSPTATAPTAYLWPRRLPDGYRVVESWEDPGLSYTIRLLPPQQGREGGYAIIHELQVGDAAELLISRSADQPRDPLMIRGLAGWVSGTTACWTELGNPVCLSIMEGSLDEILVLADGIDVVSQSEWEALRQSIFTPTPQPYATRTQAAFVPTMPAGVGYIAAGQWWEVDTAGTAQPQAAVSAVLQSGTGAQISPDRQQSLFERDGDLWVLDLTTGEARNVTNSPNQIESNSVWWPARPGAIGYLYYEAGTPPDGLDFPPTYGAIIQVDGSGQQTVTGPMGFLSSFDLGRDGESVAYLQEGQITIRRLSEAEPSVLELGDSLPAGARILNPVLSPDARTVAARLLSRWSPDQLNQAVVLVDIATGASQIIGQDTLTIEGRELGPYPGLWTPDGTWVLLFNESDNQHGLRPVRIADGFLADTIPGDVVAFSPDGTQAIVHETYRREAAEQAYVLYDAQTWRALGRLPLPEDAVIVYWR